MNVAAGVDMREVCFEAIVCRNTPWCKGDTGLVRGQIADIGFSPRRQKQGVAFDPFGFGIVGQGGDGAFQAALVASVVFSPTEQSTAVGLFKAGLVTILPFTLLGPFVGVFLDRWPRRAVLAISPVVKAAFVGLVLFDPEVQALPFYIGALAIISVNRFYLAGASAVVPRLVPAEAWRMSSNN